MKPHFSSCFIPMLMFMAPLQACRTIPPKPTAQPDPMVVKVLSPKVQVVPAPGQPRFAPSPDGKGFIRIMPDEKAPVIPGPMPRYNPPRPYGSKGDRVVPKLEYKPLSNP